MVNPYYEFFKSQAVSGGGMGYGYDQDEVNDVYRGILYQRGYGIGRGTYGQVHGLGLATGIAKLFRVAMPYLKKALPFLKSTAQSVKPFVKPALKEGAKMLGNTISQAATNIMNDAETGHASLMNSAREHSSAAAKEVYAKIPELMNQAFNQWKQANLVQNKGSGLGRKRVSRSRKGPRGGGVKRAKLNKGLLREYPGLMRLM
jgi:hypothetical protein